MTPGVGWFLANLPVIKNVRYREFRQYITIIIILNDLGKKVSFPDRNVQVLATEIYKVSSQ